MTAEQLAVFVAGLIASPLTQLVKRILSLSGWKALYTFFIVAFLLAAFAMVLTGELSVPEFVEDPIAMSVNLGEALSSVFGLATVVYKVFIAHPKE